MLIDAVIKIYYTYMVSYKNKIILQKKKEEDSRLCLKTHLLLLCNTT